VKYLLISIFFVLFVYMVYTTISTSIASNLFAEWDFLASIPWMKATLIDFYVNTIVIFTWISFRENKWSIRILYLILLVFLGSMASTVYVMIQLFKLDDDEPVSHAFLLKKG
jgi:hypothetical protein